jgi:hypothetical protein
MSSLPINIALNSVSGTNNYKSAVFRQGDRRCFAVASVNGTVNGLLRSEINNLPKDEYAAAVTAAGSELNNTTGWYKHDFRTTDMDFPAITTAATGSVSMDAASTNVTSAPVPAVIASLPPGPARRRFDFTNVSGTGTLKVDIRFTGVNGGAD